MKNLSLLSLSLILCAACNNAPETADADTGNDSIIEAVVDQRQENTAEDVKITPISHATMVLQWDNTVIYVDPIGGAEAFEGQAQPDIILVTDIHEDHLNSETLEAVRGDNPLLIVPQAVAEKLPKDLQETAKILNNGDHFDMNGLYINAIPMYNLREEAKEFHTKGRGNGYVLEKAGERVYISGDTEGIPEMRNLKDIDIAFVCMNLPYTMPVEDAADAVLAFKPKKVYPYHYRGKDGLSDVAKFKELVNQGDPDIEVVQLNWYPDMP